MLSVTPIIFEIAPIIAQAISLDTGKTIGVVLVASNAIGGLLAVAIYYLVIVVPHFVFMVIVMFTAALIFAYLNFSSHKLAPVFGMAFTTTLLIVGGALMPNIDGAQNAFNLRITMILFVVFYFVMVMQFYRLLGQPGPSPAASGQP